MGSRQHQCSRPTQHAHSDGGVQKQPLVPEATRAQQCCCECSCGAKKKLMSGLFVDEDFPARWNVLHNPSVAAAWLRPHEIRVKPRLFVEGASRFAVQQGCLGDSWFIAACAAVAERPELLEKVVPKDQVLFGPGYDGSVTFRFWHLGEWQSVRIDDRIPVNSQGICVYARCRHKDEFWLPLLEKAFAKFHKNYCFLHQDHGDSLAEGMINLTGLCITTEQIQRWDLDFYFETLTYLSEVNALILCNTGEPGPGLPGYHAYTVTKVYHYPGEKGNKDDKEMRMVRVRNPWGTDIEWAGAWKDGDSRWNNLSQEIKDAMNYKPKNDGEFWMDIDDFCENFCVISYALEKPMEAMKMDMIDQIIGHWAGDVKSGGLPDDMDSFAKNPQFLLVALGEVHSDERKRKSKSKSKKSEKSKEDDEKEEVFNPMAGMEIVVELLQEHNRKKRVWNYKIAYYMFETAAERRLTAAQMLDTTYVTGATRPSSDNSVRSLVRVFPGRRYVVIPATDTPGDEGDFLLRVYSRHARVRLTEILV